MCTDLPLIRLQDVTREIRPRRSGRQGAAPRTSLDIEQGEYVALIGPSGSGKSTLMNTLGCLDRPTSGSYLLDGQEIAQMSRDERARIRNQQIGFVFQSFNLLNRTSALENVEVAAALCAFRLRFRATPPSEGATRSEWGWETGWGTPSASCPVASNNGLRSRGALVNRPSILLADEPTGNLDSRTSREVIELFQALNEEQGLTVILVTHDPDIAQNAKRNVVLRDGQVIADTSDFSQALQSLHSFSSADAES